MRRAKILATLGPSSNTEAALTALLKAGVDGVRLNFSHGTEEQHRQMAALVRRVAGQVGRIVAILGDLSGPKIRCGTFKDGPVQLAPGARFVLTTESVPGDAEAVSVTYPLHRDLSPSDVLLLDDGLLRLRVEAVEGEKVVTRVEVGGVLSNNKGINVPGGKLKAPALTDKDRRDIEIAKEIGVDYLALSFVRGAADVLECKALAGDIPVIAKLEKPEAVAELDAIVEVCDGLMVARGDLGVELGTEKVPLVQKQAISKLNRAGKLVITATQMLDSMMRNPRPTRAEAADVANSVLDGSDVLMLSGETAAGKYPVEAVETMSSIIVEIESSDTYRGLPEPALFGDAMHFGNACARAASSISRHVKLAAVVVESHSGRTANVLAEYRPHAPIVALTRDARVAGRLALQWGIVPVVGELASSGQPTHSAGQAARAAVGAKSGESIAVLLGSVAGQGERSLTLRLLRD